MKIVFGILVACGLAVSAAPHAGLASGGLLPDCANDGTHRPSFPLARATKWALG